MSGTRQALFHLLCVFLLACAQPTTGWAQGDADHRALSGESAEPDMSEVDRHSPMASALGFMRNAELGDYEVAAEYLDLRYLPSDLADIDSQVLAEQLYTVIAREIRIDFSALSDDPAGAQEDGLPSFRDKLGDIQSSRGTVPMYLQRVPGTGESQAWKISNATVARVPELYSEFGYSPFVEAIRKFSPERTILGAELFKWIIALLAGSAGALAWMVVAWPLTRHLTRRHVALTERVRRFLMRPIPAAIFIILAFEVLRDLGLGVTATRLAEGGTLVTVVIVWLLFATTNLFRDLYGQYLQALNRSSGLMLLPPVTAAMKITIIALALILWLDNIGVNVTALVAGLGIGSLGVALALQKPLEDIMGAITLYTQQPVSIGQFCTSGNITGTIEEINLRSTRVRKVDNHIVIIPNSVFATASIENISERSRILHKQIVRLAIDTPETQVRAVLAALRALVQSHAKVAKDTWHVRFVELSQYSKDIEIFAHIETTYWNEFLEIAEEINLGTVAALESNGAKLASFAR